MKRLARYGGSVKGFLCEGSSFVTYASANEKPMDDSQGNVMIVAMIQWSNVSC